MEPTTVRQELSVNTLSLHGTPEEDVGGSHDDVVDNTTSGNQVDQPGKNFVRSAADLEECQAREAHDEEETEDRDTTLGALAEELGGSSFDCQTVKTSCCAVHICVTRREDRCAQQKVDDVREHSHTEVLHGDDVRRSSRGSCSTSAAAQNTDKGGVVVRKNDANCEATSDEEQVLS